MPIIPIGSILHYAKSPIHPHDLNKFEAVLSHINEAYGGLLAVSSVIELTMNFLVEMEDKMICSNQIQTLLKPHMDRLDKAVTMIGEVV